MPDVVGTPVTSPVDGAMVRPVGRPDADQVTVAEGDVSDAELVRPTMAAPDPSLRSACDPTVTTSEMVQVKLVEPELPALSVADRVTEHAHAVVGVPVIAPVMVLIDRPAGRPVADHDAMVAVDEESVADGVSVVMAVPETLAWAPGLVTDTELVTFQVKVVEPGVPALSVAVRVTEHAHAVVGVPVITPVVGLIDRPAGRPVADHDAMVAVDEESVADGVSGAMAVPLTLDRVPGLVTVTTVVMVQVNVAEPELPALSTAVTVVEHAHAVVGVPVITPDVALIDRPAGRPVADHDAMVAVDDESVADGVSGVMAVPAGLERGPGFATVTVLVMFQVKVVEPV